MWLCVWRTAAKTNHTNLPTSQPASQRNQPISLVSIFHANRQCIFSSALLRWHLFVCFLLSLRMKIFRKKRTTRTQTRRKEKKRHSSIHLPKFKWLVNYGFRISSVCHIISNVTHLKVWINWNRIWQCFWLTLFRKTDGQTFERSQKRFLWFK